MLARCGPTLDQPFPSTFGSSGKAIRRVECVKERSRVEQFEGIRRDSRDQGMSIRALARRHGVHRRTVRQALGGCDAAGAEGAGSAGSGHGPAC